MQKLSIATAFALTFLACIWAPTATGATTGIRITNPEPISQQGAVQLTGGMINIACTLNLGKEMINGLVSVAPQGQLTRIASITGGSVAGSPLCGISELLQFPWDVSFLDSQQNGDLNFGILRFQIKLSHICLYDGTLLGTLRADGSELIFNHATIPRVIGTREACGDNLTVHGTLADIPNIVYELLEEESLRSFASPSLLPRVS